MTAFRWDKSFRRGPWSLRGSLLRIVLLAMVVLQFVWMLLLLLLLEPSSDEVLRRGLGDSHLLKLVEQSLDRMAEREPAPPRHFEPAPELAAYLAETPGLEIAIRLAADGRVLAGVSPRLEAIVRDMAVVPTNDISIYLPGEDGRQSYAGLQYSDSPFGRFFLVINGNRFHWSDLPRLLYSLIGVFATVTGPMLVVIGILLVLLLRAVIHPVSRVAVEAAALNLDTLAQPLPLDELPRELRPLVEAINACLGRLDEAVARQRLFIANAAHEMRTPVAILSARIEQMPPGPDRVPLERDLRRLATMVEQLLAIARLGEAGRRDLVRVDAVKTARGLIADYAPLIVASGCSIRFEAPDGPQFLRCDPKGLESALGNLIDNALKVEPAGGEILVRVSRGVVLAVTDHGPGFSPAGRRHAFEPFWRESPQPGSGLGLAIVREIARLHGGEAEILAAEGTGSTILLRLPPDDQPP